MRRSVRSPARAPLAIAALATCLTLFAAPDQVRGASSRPNIVVLMTDDQTVSEMAVMRRTRRLIAGRGARFSNFFVSYPLCCPSRTTFLTGQYSHNHGVRGNGTPYGGFAAFRQPHNLGSWLQSAGYHTTHIGKFLNGYGEYRPRDIPPGWDEWQVPVDSPANAYFGYRLNENGRLVFHGYAPRDYKTDVYRRKALRAIRRHEARGPDADPYFLFVGFTAPHLAAVPAPRHAGTFRGRPLPRIRSFDERDVSDKPRFIRRIPHLDSAAKRRIRRDYRRRAETLLAVDEAVAAIVRELGSRVLARDTYLFFVSDNGYFFGDHRIARGKYLPYESSVHVPLLIRGPGIPPGGVAGAMTANVDLAPTILGLTGASPTVIPDGRSLMPFARNPGLGSDRPILLEAYARDLFSPGIPYRGIRTQRYKYIEYRSGERELYDLARDPAELHSRHGERRYRSTRRALDRLLGRLAHCVGQTCRRGAGRIPGPRRPSR